MSNSATMRSQTCNVLAGNAAEIELSCSGLMGSVDNDSERIPMTLDATLPTATHDLVLDAVRPRRGLSLRAVQDRLFAWAFTGLVYPQIWEDPEVDMAAMNLQPHHHVVCIASGGCNALSYLTRGVRKVTAVDLNEAHVALVRLKIAGLRHLPDWHHYYRFFGEAKDKNNAADYFHYLAPHLDAATRRYWETKGRLKCFQFNIYKHGLLGRFITLGHIAGRAYGLRVSDLLDCTSLEEQRIFFESRIAPLFHRPLVRLALRSPMALFGLGIPPAQFEALSGGRPMDEVVKERLAEVACAFPLSENYFTWQAFGRGYAPDGAGPLPPYLQEKNFTALHDAAARISVTHANMRDALARQPAGSVDRITLLDAQDWMTEEQMNDLWQAISAAAAPDARVIFRTAGEETILPGKLDATLLSRWQYLDRLSAELHAKDRSGIYGGFHVYQLRA